MCTHQIFSTHFLKIKKIILRSDLTQRNNFNAVGFSIRCLEKQVLKVSEPLRVTHCLAERLDVGAALCRVGHIHGVLGVRPVLIILPTEQRSGLIQLGGIKCAQVLR